jgi:hypothetical protein
MAMILHAPVYVQALQQCKGAVLLLLLLCCCYVQALLQASLCSC